MPFSPFHPRVSLEERLLHLNYELPYRIHTSKIYPIPSPNGSTIIVSGYENGLQIWWRGGKPFKPRPEEPKPQSNGVKKTEVINLDSDEDDTPPVIIAEFEDEEPDIDPLEPYPPILQHLDLALGTAVLHLSFPHIPLDRSTLSADVLSPIASKKIIIATVCADNCIRIITVPIIPPSPEFKKAGGTPVNFSSESVASGCWSEQIVVLSGPLCHQVVPSGVSITFTPKHQTQTSNQNDEEWEAVSKVAKDGIRLLPGDMEKRNLPKRRVKPEQQWDILVASHSPEITGLLLIFRIPILSAAGKEYKLASDHAIPIQIQHLPSYAISISFNPSLYPSRRHTKLLVVDSKGSVRIYQCLSETANTQRPSSSSPGNKNALGPTGPERGSWLASFYPGYSGATAKKRSSKTTPNDRNYRKLVLGAQWILGGKAIVVLLGNGEWGVWDLEGSGPGAQKEGLLGGDVGRLGVQGGGISKWAVNGWVETKPAFTNIVVDKLVPMTPGTRTRVSGDTLFSSSSQENRTLARGGISCLKVRDSPDETLVFWYNNTLLMIPSLWSFWRSYWKKEQICGEGPEGQEKLIGDPRNHLHLTASLRGELISNVSQTHAINRTLAKTTTADEENEPSKINSFLPDTKIPSEILITAEHRIVMISTPPSSTKKSSSNAPTAIEKPLLIEPEGDLDVMDIDRVLDTMEHRPPPYTNGSNIGKRKVDFTLSTL
ncbi:MAG: hypothetical protein M1829_002010 [Trizodia sp. TS-e1964]|nr:MAG: hypothetical protein M1829_002010 [Trizodia sp. TS-e1964]